MIHDAHSETYDNLDGHRLHNNLYVGWRMRRRCHNWPLTHGATIDCRLWSDSYDTAPGITYSIAHSYFAISSRTNARLATSRHPNPSSIAHTHSTRRAPTTRG